jgi:signal transduction histidine kinase
VQSALRGAAETALSARDEFISTTARELRTPVLGIKTDAQLALHVLAGATSDRELMVLGYVQDILGSADRLLVLTNSLTELPGIPVPRG